MSFANPLPIWAFCLVAAGAALLGWHAYRRVGIGRGRRLALAGLRSSILLLIVVFLMRPVARSADADARDAVVPILVDTSRSMGIDDADGRRIDVARRLVEDRLLPAVSARFRVEVLGFDEALVSRDPAGLSATGRESDLRMALDSLRERYRGRALAGVLLVSDGGDTSQGSEAAASAGPPVFAIGVGAADAANDREVLSVTVAEAVLDGSRIDLAVTAVSHGQGTDPIELRLLENGRLLEVRHVQPAAAGIPLRETFQVAPPGDTPALYSVVIPARDGELVPENNARSVLVQPPVRPRRILLVEGAPGYEHSFLKRAWAADPGLEIDSVVRKGRNEQGHDTFYVQAVRSRSASLEHGYPTRMEDLFRYDAVVLANVEAEHLTRAQLDATRAFVGRRGGGLLVLGARSFLAQGLVDTPLEDVLPLDLKDRRAGVAPAAARVGINRVALTADGAAHPIMQLAPEADESRKRWDELPPVASIAPLGGPRPGAFVLAASNGPGGAPRALVAVQRFGEGRALVFTGEAAWRWRMMRPAADRSYDTFWRQAVRWLAVPASDPVALSAPSAAAAGENLALRVAVRDEAFLPLAEASVELRVTAPDGRIERLRGAPDRESSDGAGFVAHFRAPGTGVYRATADARVGERTIGTATTAFLVGGADAEMSEPRLNLQLLHRVAAASGGRVISPDDLSSLLTSLHASVPSAALVVRRDLWHSGWSFAVVIVLLAGEWILRRRWGLR